MDEPVAPPAPPSDAETTFPRPAPPEPAAAVPPPVPSPAGREPHLWAVAYHHGVLGDDGIWRFPHRCRTCGVEVLGRDIGDATAQDDAHDVS